MTAAPPPDPQLAELFAALTTHLVGTVSREAAATAAVAADYSRQVGAPPALVVSAQCESDVVHTLRLARAAGVPVSVRGAGHSGNGKTLCPGGIVLVNYTEEPRFSLRPDGVVEVEARTTWRALEAGLCALGRSAPVLTDYLGLTVGGTLSVGGYGVRSPVYGAQVDHVLGLRLVLPDGAALWCSPQSDRPRFEAALAGLGEAGVLERVLMRTLPARRHFRAVLHVHPNLTQLAASLAWFVDWLGDPASALCFDAFLIDGLVVSEYATEGLAPESIPELPMPLRARPVAQRLGGQDYAQHVQAQRVRWLARFPQHHALWCDWFFAYPEFCSFLRFLDESREAGGLSPYLQAVYVLVCRPPASGPRPPRVPDLGRVCYSVGLYFMVPPASDAEHAMAEAATARRRCEERARALGGRPYLYGCYDSPPAGI